MSSRKGPTLPRRHCPSDVTQRTALLWLVLGLFCGCASRDATPVPLRDGEVVRVVNIVKGDELTVAAGKGDARVRMLGIQAFSAVVTNPQVQALSAGSVAALKDLIGTASVKLIFDTPVQDSSGRYLAYVYKDDLDLNRRMLEEGWAVVYTEYPFGREADYLVIETKARLARRNLWGLEPAAEIITGLRKQWAEARRASQRTATADPLLP